MNDIKGVIKSTMVSLGIVMLTPWFHHNFLRIETVKYTKKIITFTLIMFCLE